MDDNRDLFGSGTESEQEENEEHVEHEEHEEHEGDEEEQGEDEEGNEEEEEDEEVGNHEEHEDNEEEVDEEEHGDGEEEHQEHEENNDDEERHDEEEHEEQEENNNEDEEDDDEVVRKAPKATDVFGDELADLSEDEEKESDDEDHHQSVTQSRHHIQDEEEETEPEQIISIEIPRVKTDLGKEIHFVKLPNFLSVEPKPFDAETYEDENPNGETLDEEGKTRVRLKVENTIRWRYEKDLDGNLVKQSNARIVKWSDGSMSLYLGNEIFDVYKTFMQGDHNHLFVRQNNVLHGQTVFRTKLTFRPHSTDSMTHRKMTMSLVDRGAKTKKVKILTEMKKNPEYKRMELMKKEEEKLKAASRRQNQQRRIREKSHSKGITSNYLEDKYHSEEDEMSLNAIKNKFKSRADNRNFYSSSDESDKDNRRSSKSKKNLDDSDEYDDDDYDEDEDDDLNRSKKSNSGSQKNKKKKKVVLDDEDE